MARPILSSNDGSPRGFMSTITVKGRSVTVEKRALGRRPGAVPVDRRQDLASRLDQIEGRIKRLTVSRRDPDRFFEQRSEIADDVRKLALELRF